MFLSASVATWPNSARSEPAGAIIAPATPRATFAPVRTVRALAQTARDPFAGDDDSTPAPSPAPANVSVGTIGPLPPNAGAFVQGQPQRDGPVRVRALGTGPHPYALIAEGAATRLVAPGDRIGIHAVTAITLEGVMLDDGSLLGFDLTPATAATPPFAPRRDSR